LSLRIRVPGGEHEMATKRMRTTSSHDDDYMQDEDDDGRGKRKRKGLVRSASPAQKSLAATHPPAHRSHS
jgi:hypothetical protein